MDISFLSVDTEGKPFCFPEKVARKQAVVMSWAELALYNGGEDIDDSDPLSMQFYDILPRKGRSTHTLLKNPTAPSRQAGFHLLWCMG